ncbi:MAG: FAD-dependent monooxygenase, partial [Chlamydiia bacterium]|nr:FAD-dependent monooxygenase [Chlamydiia bacterium]
WKNNFYSYAEVDKLAGIYPISEKEMATFMVWKWPYKGIEPLGRPREVIREIFKDSESFVPDLLTNLDKAKSIYIDLVTQIKMKTWSKGRVTLVGDAGACLTLLAGQGATMAMAEAYILAHELKKTEGNYKQAFTEYENILRPVVEQKQKEAENFASSFVPQSKLVLWIYNVAVRFIHHPYVLKWVFKNLDTESIFTNDYKMHTS